MGLNPTSRRRWLGAISLLTALLMLLAGETLLKEQLSPLGYLIYWLVCFGLTFIALAMAFLDLRALGLRAREQQRELFDATLRDIEFQARKRPQTPPQPPQKLPPPARDS
jgi:hypothetical protein